MGYIKVILKGTGWFTLGLLFLSISGEQDARYGELQANGIQTTGEVTSVKYSGAKSSDYGAKNAYQKVTIAYSVEGKKYVIDREKKLSAFDGPSLTEGQEVTVFVDKGNFSNMEIERNKNPTFWEKANRWVPYVFIVTGICYLISPVFIFLGRLVSKIRRK